MGSPLIGTSEKQKPMNLDGLERIKLYITETRKQDVLAARNSRLNGYTKIASDHENRVLMADMALRDLREEIIGQYAVQI